MKRFFILYFGLLLYLPFYGQNTQPIQTDAKMYSWEDFEELPRYYDKICEQLESEEERQKCSEKKLLEVIYKNIKYPPISRELPPMGTCIIQLTINEKGEIEERKILKDVEFEHCSMAIEATKALGKWIPPTVNGKFVRFSIPLPIRLCVK